MANAFVHIELSTDDLAKAKKFYKTLFDWKVTDMPDMSYAMINVGKGTGGGMMKKHTPEQPTMWLPYIEVDSVKKTVAKAKKAGATAMVEYMAISEEGGQEDEDRQALTRLVHSRSVLGGPRVAFRDRVLCNSRAVH